MILQYFLYFSAYSIVGWLFESTVCSISARKPVNRGFLFGPVCPIYGFGAVAAILFLSPFKNNPILLFVLSILVLSFWEYLVSLFLEKVFHKSWWDYSEHPLNLNGRVSLGTSLVWGVLSVLLIYFIHPFVITVMDRIPKSLNLAVAAFLLAAFLADVLFSVRDTIRFNRELVKLTELATRIEKIKDELKEIVTAFGVEQKESLRLFREEQKERLESELTKLTAQQEIAAEAFLRTMRRILEAFPRIRQNRRDRVNLKDKILNYLSRK